MMKKMWKIRKDKSAVSPVIATILMVAITVVLAAVLYVMVMGFGGSNTTSAPTATLSKSGGQLTISISSQTNASKIGVAVVFGAATNYYFIYGSPATTATTGVTWTFSHTNYGYVSTGDSITVTLPTTNAATSVQLVYMPSSSATATDKTLIGNVITF
jgi:archaeal type IV pilus assembly protein PilA